MRSKKAHHHKQQSLKPTQCTKCGEEIQVIHITPGVKCWDCEKRFYYHKKELTAAEKKEIISLFDAGMTDLVVTPLVGVKWTKSTLVKALEQNYTQIFQQLIKSDLPTKEKNEKIDQCLKIFLSIYQPVMEFGVKVKKI